MLPVGNLHAKYDGCYCLQLEPLVARAHGEPNPAGAAEHRTTSPKRAEKKRDEAADVR